jgi:antirestriction protein ArdC
MNVPISHGGWRADYSPASDTIQVPLREALRSTEVQYGVLAHEAVESHVSLAAMA